MHRCIHRLHRCIKAGNERPENDFVFFLCNVHFHDMFAFRVSGMDVVRIKLAILCFIIAIICGLYTWKDISSVFADRHYFQPSPKVTKIDYNTHMTITLAFVSQSKEILKQVVTTLLPIL